MANMEKILNALAKGEDVSGFEPQSRIESLLLGIKNASSKSGLPIEVNSLDDSLLVAENEGKIYVCDGKLYRVVSKETLKGTTVTFTGSHTFTAPSEYGYFKIKGSYEKINTYFSSTEKFNFYEDGNPNLYIGFLQPSPYEPNEGDICVVVDEYGSSRAKVFSSVSAKETLKLIITGGEDASNPLLKQWVIDNNGVIKGEGIEYHFEEILIKKPQLVDLTGATVTFNTDGLTAGLGEFNIEGNIEANTKYEGIQYYGLYSNLNKDHNFYLGYDKTDGIYSYDNSVAVSYIYWEGDTSYTGSTYITGEIKLTITGGRDVDNNKLIKILLEHNAVIEGGVYE